MNSTKIVRIPWRDGDTISDWNDTCAWALEQFGLPGDRFTTHPTEDYMEFHFKHEPDAVIFILRWSK
jgi:hypothetical protein